MANRGGLHSERLIGSLHAAGPALPGAVWEKPNVVASMIFGGISGSSVADTSASETS
ncbi:MAG: hypothetical protein M0C28_41435 [Candidatus Moduliflexus flocculans]|nr:hypothetical protein [Candidatus Moduliflexus flocculans]